MKIISFAQRLLRDLKFKALADMDNVARLELLDAINGGLQALNALAPNHTKETKASLVLPAPTSISIAVEAGSAEFTGYTVDEADLYCTVRIDGDGVDNQITGSGMLLHPYGGITGTVNATIYHDAALIGDGFEALVGQPFVLETRKFLTPYPGTSPIFSYWSERQAKAPCFYVIEGNGRNNNPPAPKVFRVESLPERLYRLQVGAKLAPARVGFADLNNDTAEVPFRPDHVELYLLPVCRGILADSAHWEDKEGKGDARAGSENAKANYSALVSPYVSTPQNAVGTPYGF